MSDKATRKIYHIREDIELDQIKTVLTGKEYEYNILDFNKNLQSTNDVEISVLGKANNYPPEWIGLINVYLGDTNFFLGAKRFDLVILIKCKSKENKNHIFALCFGTAYFHVEDFLDHSFGISILEAIFDPKINKIKTISEKSLVGDTAYSSRRYRRPRSVAYEDDFGKYYQEINSSITFSQIKQWFPNFIKYRGEKSKPDISVDGCSSIELKMGATVVGIIKIVKDLTDIISSTHPKIFHKSLVPLDPKKQQELVDSLNEQVFETIIDFYLEPDIKKLDFEICHRNVEAFFSSVSCQFLFPQLHSTKDAEFVKLDIEDIYSLSDSYFIQQLFNKIEESIEIRKAINKRSFFKEILSEILVSTINEDGLITTKGAFIEYIQIEIAKNNISYFLLDNQWFLLQDDFDKSIDSKYKNRVSSHFSEYTFMHKWDEGDELTYNQKYNTPPKSLYLHLVKVNNVELCDAMIIDIENKIIHIIHVKEYIGANIRDLTSQVYIASSIIEDEAQTNKSDSIKQLYLQAVNNQRIDLNTLSQENFIQWLTSFRREYILAIHDKNKSSEDIRLGNFDSRIAKFSLVQFATQMQANNWNFSICCV